MTEARQRLGRLAEDLTCSHLAALGWKVIARNVRTRLGELDIVALDRSTLVFVEVKAGRANAFLGPERPVLAVDSRKQRRLRRLATAWTAANRSQRYEEIRFDAVGVTFDRAGRLVDFEHLEGAF